MDALTVEIVTEGTDRYREITREMAHPDGDVPAAHVTISRFESRLKVGSTRTLITSVRVCGFDGRSLVHAEDVTGGSRWEPETRNQIGGLGASRDLPPSTEAIDVAVARARDAITAAPQQD